MAFLIPLKAGRGDGPLLRRDASSRATPACLIAKRETQETQTGMIFPRLPSPPPSKGACSGSRSETPFCGRLGQGQESSMTLTILDPRSGETVTIYVENVPAVRQPIAAKVVTHPRFRKPH